MFGKLFYTDRLPDGIRFKVIDFVYLFIFFSFLKSATGFDKSSRASLVDPTTNSLFNCRRLRRKRASKLD